MYDREVALKKSLDDAMMSIFSLPRGNYYDGLTIEKLIKFKTLLKDVNNIITLQLSVTFVDYLRECFNISQEDSETIREKIRQSKPNANGYDIDIKSPADIIAEVKCNLPINGGVKYGANQKDRLIENLNGLKDGKKKAKLRKGSFKFLALYDHESVRKATAHLVENLPSEMSNCVEFLETPNGQDIRQDKIYIVFIKLN